MKYIDLKGLKIFDIYGVTRIPLNGRFSKTTLSNKLIKEWIPYVDCQRKCSRSDYCKFTKRNPYHPDLLTDIKCGIVVQSLRNVVNATFSILENKSTEHIQEYLDSLFHFTQIILKLEMMLGDFSNKHTMDWYGNFAQSLIGHFSKTRDSLNILCEKLKNIPELGSLRGVFFVEGHSEKAFLDKLKELGDYWFSKLIVEVYSGKGNRKLRRIEMLIDHFLKIGYQIYIQGDLDGSSGAPFKKLVEKGLIKMNNVFTFKYDFESSIPPSVLHCILQHLGKLPNVDLEEFIDKIYPLNNSVVRILESVFGINIKSIKIQIASLLGEIVDKNIYQWLRDDKFLETEFGQFIRFVQDIQ